MHRRPVLSLVNGHSFLTAEASRYLPNGTRFATEEALEEIRRVLKPNAVFGMIWNVEDCESA